MKRKFLKKILIGTGSFLLALTILLAVHIYIVTRPGAVDANTIAMARLDFKQNISSDDAGKITSWLYQQTGINHVLCNASTDIAVFTFYPMQISANDIAKDLNRALNYSAVRIMPSAKDLQSSCPVMASSFTYKAYNLFKNIF